MDAVFSHRGIDNQVDFSIGYQDVYKRQGLGGLGSNVAFSLARIGVGHLHLLDFDRVDITNLNRQQYFMRHIGMYKTEALKEELAEINPYLDITADCIKVTEDNIAALFAADDMICEAFDDPEAKAMLANGILELYPEKFLIAASGMAGYGESNAIHTRKITEHFYPVSYTHLDVYKRQMLDNDAKGAVEFLRHVFEN